MTGTDNSPKAAFNIVEANIADHRKALDSGEVTSVDLVVSYLNRIARYDTCEGLNAFTVFNENVLEEAAASDARRAQGLKPRPLEGIPYTIKDSYKVAGMTATAGSPALEGVISNEDSAIAKKLRDAGAILMGKTNMPPMAAGGMQRGLYGRAESPYNSKYLTAAFSSGSSNGAGTSIAASMAVFGMGSETVSSGRSPASNNALVCYTPSKGLLSCRGLWPLYVTCDVPTPYTRTVDDMLEVLNIIATPDKETAGDFVREQKHVAIPPPPQIDYTTLRDNNALKGKRIGVPKMYVGQKDSDPHAKPTYVSPEVIALWDTTAKDLEKLGAEIIYTDFPLVTNYENDSVSGEANNVAGQPADWNHLERGLLIAQAWDGFLRQNNDPKIKCLADIKDPAMLFPKPKDYVPDTFLEVRNWINYAGLPKLVQPDKSIHDVPGLKQALLALEAQRKRDLEDWMDSHKLDLIAFPAQGDVGLADLEFNLDSATHSLRNGVKYSNGNRAIRHLGVPTVSVPMGVMPDPKNMPVNITFAGRAYKDTELLAYAYAFEAATKKRVSPSRTPKLDTDDVVRRAVVQVSSESDSALLRSASEPKSKPTHERLIQNVEVKITDRPMPHVVTISIKPTLNLSSSSSSTTDEKKEKKHPRLQIFIQGKKVTDTEWTSNDLNVACPTELVREVALGWDLKPLKYRDVMIVVVATDEEEGGKREAKLVWGRLGEVARAS